MVNKFHPPARPSESLPRPHVFSGEKIHDASKDHMSIARLSKNVGLSLSGIISGESNHLDTYQILTDKNPTRQECELIIDWAIKMEQPIYLLYGTRGGSVIPVDVSGKDSRQLISEIRVLLESNTPFMLARKNENIQGGVTAMDMLSTEGITRDGISEFIDRLLSVDSVTGKNRGIFFQGTKKKSLSKREIAAGQIQLVNQVYGYAVQFLEFLGIHLMPEQKKRTFQSVEEFKEHVYRIKPELNEPERKDKRYVFKRKDGVGMIIECALVRAMDHIYDTFSNERFRALDEEAILISEKLKSIPGVRITNLTESSFDIRYIGSDGYFEGTIYLRKKNFFKILLKMAYNRKYGSAEAMNDLLGMRFETLNPSEENMANAVAFFQRHLFDSGAIYDQKGGLLSQDAIDRAGIQAKSDTGKKAGTNSKLVNGDITGTVTHEKSSTSISKTGKIEMQFQRVGGMETGFNKREIYELKKILSAAARIMKGFDIKNLKFFIQLFVVEETGMDEHSILQHLFFPTEGWDNSMSPESIDENAFYEFDQSSLRIFARHKELELPKDPLEAWIEKYWDKTHGFILPMRSGKGGVRFTTRDVISPSFYDVYDAAYPKPASITFDYLLRMYERADVRKEVEAFRRLGWSLDHQGEIHE